MSSKTNDLNVLSYELLLSTDMSNERFTGTVNISFLISPEAREVVFDCGNLQITEITGSKVAGFTQKNKKVIISLNSRDKTENHIQITYSGSPSHGIVFIPKSQSIYTVFSTSQWMVCNDSPNDRATFKIELSIPNGSLCIASGVLKNTSNKGDKTQYSWVQDYESPSYTYGFAIGPFNKFQETHGKISLNYYSTNHTLEQLKTIFRPTGEIIDFFEAKSGIPYVQSSYSQILIGNHYQEMSGFSVLKESYGELVMNDSTETNLISHELAHQWWGNMITCEDWNHFWLNEGLATFMSAAFNEHKFGKHKYESDIDSYRKVYESVKNKGKDKSLVFDDWLNPTREDRNLVYFKGAYVIHLLRMELGEKDFWGGIKFYSQEYFGKSVNTLYFQKAMEESTGRDLSAFFNKWINKTEG
ncbi:M1 family aminopeptidase [Maribacter halichondriae]|uniref:M1 family aminopeptidase n=1 Tax=Maribacter halichondriae TaxID=2980554 RepID=UPI0023587B48|nr:M1 family aminopeptidase [Maribacter sp. Hal144]